MIVFPNAKINIGLNILDKRTDGYHDLETVFFPVVLKDALECIEDRSQAEDVSFKSYGRNIDGSIDNNLCVRAYRLLKKDFPNLPQIRIILYKEIPMGAGMGGGSADAAFMLKLLDKQFNLRLTETRLCDYALMLGSDVPFFILNKPCIGRGRGEKLIPIELNLSQYHILLINPGIHIHTSEAFASLRPNRIHHSILSIMDSPIEIWKELFTNDFEIPVFEKFPEIAGIKETLYRHGAIYASMSGSGSTVYGIFSQKPVDPFTFPEHYFQKWV